MRIAILIPTRARVTRFKKVYKSILDTANDPSNIITYAGTDSDDPHLQEYVETFRGIKNIENPIFSERRSVPEIMDIMSRLAINHGADLIIIASDDVVFQTLDWDIKLQQYYSKYKDRLLIGYFNNGRDRQMCEHFVASKEWIRTLGYYVPIEFNHFYVDTYISDIALRVGRLIWMRDIVLKHEHFKYQLAPYDATYARTRTNNFSRRDEAIYNLMENRRVIEAQKIRDAMLCE